MTSIYFVALSAHSPSIGTCLSILTSDGTMKALPGNGHHSPQIKYRGSSFHSNYKPDYQRWLEGWYVNREVLRSTQAFRRDNAIKNRNPFSKVCLLLPGYLKTPRPICTFKYKNNSRNPFPHKHHLFWPLILVLTCPFSHISCNLFIFFSFKLF